MDWLQNLKIKHKIFLLVSFAGIGFLSCAIVNYPEQAFSFGLMISAICVSVLLIIESNVTTVNAGDRLQIITAQDTNTSSASRAMEEQANRLVDLVSILKNYDSEPGEDASFVATKDKKQKYSEADIIEHLKQEHTFRSANDECQYGNVIKVF
jgi:hypothetical protein